MEVISSIQKTILSLFGAVVESDQFYLTGGTALSYFYLKHRQSHDLDFFTPTLELIVPFSFRLEEALKNRGMTVQRQRSFHSFVEFFLEKDQEKTVIQLAQDSPFRFEPPKKFPEFPNLNIDSLVDIASNKLLALFSRAALRDFIDLYFLIQKGHFTTLELIEKAKTKDPGFELYWLGVAFEQIKTFNPNSTEMLLLVEPLDLGGLYTFFDRWREQIVRKLRP